MLVHVLVLGRGGDLADSHTEIDDADEMAAATENPDEAQAAAGNRHRPEGQISAIASSGMP